jgi:amidase
MKTDSTNPRAYTGPELCGLSAREVVQQLRVGELSPNDVLAAAYERMDKVEPAINAIVTRCDTRAQNAARGIVRKENLQAEPGWLAGLPLAIKDLTLVEGVRTTFGNQALSEFIPTYSDPLVERLEARGGVVVGKSNTPEFGAGGNTFNQVFGATRNPYDTRRNAGGSSGGAAAALATGEVWLAHGSDLAGSLRTPAAYCGVVGLRPTPGRCGGGPAVTAFSTEGISGPMARDVSDIALFLDAMTGYDPRMPLSMDAPSISFQQSVAQASGRVRIAFSEDQNGFAPVDASTRTVLRDALSRVERAGATVEYACPLLPDLQQTYTTLRGMHYGAVNAFLPESVQATFKQTLKENTAYGKTLGSAAIYRAIRQRTVLYQIMRTFLNDYDVLAIPVTGLAPGPVEEEYPSLVDGQTLEDYLDWLRFSFLATTTTLPAISVPAGFDDNGMPVGVQLIGPPRGEARLLQVARAVEDAVNLGSAPIDPVVRH